MAVVVAAAAVVIIVMAAVVVVSLISRDDSLLMGSWFFTFIEKDLRTCGRMDRPSYRDNKAKS